MQMQTISIYNNVLDIISIKNNVMVRKQVEFRDGMTFMRMKKRVLIVLSEKGRLWIIAFVKAIEDEEKSFNWEFLRHLPFWLCEAKLSFRRKDVFGL